MKKILAALLAATVMFSVVGCAGNKTPDPNPDEQNQEVENNGEDADVNGEDADVNGEDADVNGEVADVNGEDADVNGEDADVDADDDNEIVMATNAYFQPYEYHEGDKIVGIDAEIAEAIAAKLGKTLRIEDMQFDSILTAVQEGSVDFGMAGMTVTDERKESVDFTSSYASGVQAIIVKEGSAITTVDDLYADGASYKIGIQLGTTGDNYCTDDFGTDRVVQFSNGNEAALALVGGSVDCVIIDNEPAKALAAANEGLTLLETSYADEDYAICVAKGNTELLDALNAAIDELTADGTIDTIVAKYIK